MGRMPRGPAIRGPGGDAPRDSEATLRAGARGVLTAADRPCGKASPRWVSERSRACRGWPVRVQVLFSASVLWSVRLRTQRAITTTAACRGAAWEAGLPERGLPGETYS